MWKLFIASPTGSWKFSLEVGTSDFFIIQTQCSVGAGNPLPPAGSDLLSRLCQDSAPSPYRDSCTWMLTVQSPKLGGCLRMEMLAEAVVGTRLFWLPLTIGILSHKLCGASSPGGRHPASTFQFSRLGGCCCFPAPSLTVLLMYN